MLLCNNCWLTHQTLYYMGSSLSSPNMIPFHVFKEAKNAIPTAFAPGIQAQALCDALRWITSLGKITYISSINVLMAPQEYLLTYTAQITHEKKKQQVEHIPIALAQLPALLAHVQLRLPSIRHIVNMWDSIYRKMDNGDIKNMLGKLLQINGQDYKKVNATLLKNIVFTPVEKYLPLPLRKAWLKL